MADIEPKMPAVWSEKGETTESSDLKKGYLVRIYMDNANLPKQQFTGIYCDIQKSDDHGWVLMLEVAGEHLIPDTAGKLCRSEMKECYLPWIRLIEILARDTHAIHVLFHTLGVAEIRYKNAENTIRRACAFLYNPSIRI